MAYLVLSNGMAFPGRRFGANADATGPLIYSTGVVGYAETLLNPHNARKIIVQSFPLIGNVGIDAERRHDSISVAGYVIRELCEEPNHFLCDLSLDAWLKEQGIPGIAGIDTRHLVHLLKEDPTLTATITDTLPNSTMGGNSNA